jgi:hypothetical protein
MLAPCNTTWETSNKLKTATVLLLLFFFVLKKLLEFRNTEQLNNLEPMNENMYSIRQPRQPFFIKISHY